VYAAGHDLYSAKDVTIPARGRALVGTDISISVPVGTCASLPSDLVAWDESRG
jgi:dUTP pyrophosphatase